MGETFVSLEAVILLVYSLRSKACVRKVVAAVDAPSIDATDAWAGYGVVPTNVKAVASERLAASERRQIQNGSGT